MKYEFAYRSDRGPRTQNEDAVAGVRLRDDVLAVAIADGLGGHFGGADASKMAVRMFEEALIDNSSQSMLELGRTIHEHIVAEQNDPNRRGMATTFTAAKFDETGIVGLHCGDSRLVVIRRQGIKRLTQDHTEAQRLFTAGKLTKESYRTYPRKNILESALGMQTTPRIDEIFFKTEPGDKYVFTTDGVHGKLMLREIFEISLNCDEPEEFVDSVIDAVRGRIPDDNFTVASVYVR